MIILDTCVILEAFRKKGKGAKISPATDQLRQMIEDDWPIAIPGIVLQEFLTGFRSDRSIQQILDLISGFPRILAEEDDHILGARIRSICLKKGLAATGIDCLIAATAINRNGRLFTFDQDFVHISKVCHLKLFSQL